MIHVVLPVQYLQTAGRRRMEAEKPLMVAVLQTDAHGLREELGVAGAPG